MTRNPIIVALDVDSAQEARSLVAKLGKHVNFYKVGLELYAAAGVEFVHELIHEGKDVFLDLKVYDIPETVKRAVAQVARTGVKFLTTHAVGSVMRAAVEGRGDSHLKLLAVTVLTSFGPEDLAEQGYKGEIADLVALRARMAMKIGIDGIVASPLEAAAVRKIIGRDKVLVTPGVRSAGAAKGDQKRTATPLEAVRDGADYLVIGRQITRAENPADEAERVLDEIGAAWVA
ncbi:MAG TPA: orotidine-5'-phosphate decarboxylase [Bryobacteraceae bacterium]|jgi:orotidine-5'-phosphate decarboxylase|nr:orotidine-5'-phosphate decarboxylase [Bryobacteraceae bacterium]